MITPQILMDFVNANLRQIYSQILAAIRFPTTFPLLNITITRMQMNIPKQFAPGFGLITPGEREHRLSKDFFSFTSPIFRQISTCFAPLLIQQQQQQQQTTVLNVPQAPPSQPTSSQTFIRAHPTVNRPAGGGIQNKFVFWHCNNCNPYFFSVLLRKKFCFANLRSKIGSGID